MLGVYEAAKEAVDRARSGRGPTLLEFVTYRITGHSRRDPALYQPEAERKEALENEPIGRFTQFLLDAKRADQPGLDRIKSEVDEEIEAAVKDAIAAPEPKPEDALEDFFVESIKSFGHNYETTKYS